MSKARWAGVGMAVVALGVGAWSVAAWGQAEGTASETVAVPEAGVAASPQPGPQAVGAPALVGVSDSQRTEVRAAMRRARRDFIRLGADLRVARLNLTEAQENAAASETDIRNLSAQAADLQKQLAQRRTELQLELRRIVGPEQWAQRMQRRDTALLRGLAGRRRQMPGQGGAGVQPGVPPGPQPGMMERFQRNRQRWGNRFRRDLPQGGAPQFQGPPAPREWQWWYQQP